MLYYVETTLDNFTPWSGAISLYNRIMDDAKAYDAISDYLEEATTKTEWSETEINDFIWFDSEDYLVNCGIWEYEE